MTLPILATKLYVPPIRSNLVTRQRLLARLNEGLECKLSLVSAPAGFGKTTLLSEWVNSCEHPVAWISLDDGDNDLSRFLAYLVTGLEQIAPDIGEGRIDVLNSPQHLPLESLMTDLINELAEIPGQFIVVLDDYHVIENRDIHTAVTFLLENQPPGMHLVISSRADPPWPMARLRSRCEMTEMRASELRFTESESADFLVRIMGLDLSMEAVNDLDERTEGWIAGLQMAALSMRGRDDSADFIHSFAGSHRFVLDYLVEEVLQKQPEDIQSFLLKTSILDRLTEPLCDEITGGDDSRDMMYELDQTNLFLIPLDDERRWYRYHPLFADLLRSRLEQEHPDQLAELHGAASRWFEKEELIEEAIQHAFLASDMERAADLVERYAMSVISQSKARTLLNWIESIPPEILERRPMLCAYMGWSRYWTGQRENVEECLVAAERSLEHPDHKITDQDRDLVEGYIAAIRSYLAVTDEDIFRVIEMSQKALKQLPETNYMRGIAAMALGVTYWGLGDVLRAQDAFQQAVDITWNGGHQNLALAASCYVGIQQEKRGLLREALDTYREALEKGSRRDGHWIPFGGFPAERLGNVYREWNDLEEAAKYINEGLVRCERLAHPDILADSYLSKLRLQLALGDLDGAEKMLEQLDSLAQAAKLDPWADTWIDECRITLWLRRGNLEDAQRWAESSHLRVDTELSYMHDLHHINLARVLIAQGTLNDDSQALEEAREWLSILLEAAIDAGWVREEIRIRLYQAIAHEHAGKDTEAMESMREALTLGEPGGFVRIFLDEGEPVEKLLRKGRAAGIARGYVDTMLGQLSRDDRGGRIERPGIRMRPADLSSRLSSVSAREPLIKDEPLIVEPLIVEPLMVEPLTEREMQVLRLLFSELSVPEIAEELIIGVSTVRTHVKNIYGKLGVHSRYQAVSRARRLGLVGMGERELKTDAY